MDRSLGLSPHLRGSRQRADFRHELARPIPAPAGQPFLIAKSKRRTRAYPRTCGAAHVLLALFLHGEGLSPHLRGSRNPLRLAHLGKRPIPAPAGQPSAHRAAAGAPRAYPRTCGAATGIHAGLWREGGLSPHLRGSRCRMAPVPGRCGPIPAPAGQPNSKLYDKSDARAYPRTCGAAPDRHRRAGDDQGLSPHLRGSRERHRAAGPLQGPIPAPAGQPASGSRRRKGWGAYPRTCGAACPCSRHSPTSRGLSPHLRGSPQDVASNGLNDGPIPAPAGQPIWTRSDGTPRGAYPRTCGAAPCYSLDRSCTVGLSPHLRGSRCGGEGGADPLGPIPAPAGQPPGHIDLLGASRAYPRTCGAARAE